jgi:hypothetical protein
MIGARIMQTTEFWGDKTTALGPAERSIGAPPKGRYRRN